MKDYPINSLLSINSYSNYLSSTTKIYDKDDDLNITNSFINHSSFTLSTKDKDYYSIDDSKKFHLYEESLASFSSTSSSANSSITSLPLPSSSTTYSLPLSTPDNHDLCMSHYSYEPLSMTISEPKRHHEEFTYNSVLKWNVYSSGKINSISRYLVISGILLGSFYHLDPFELEDKFITPMKYLATCLIIFSLAFRIFTGKKVQNLTCKNRKHIKSHVISSTNNDVSPSTYTTPQQPQQPQQQPQQDGTVSINMEQDNQSTNNTREFNHENSAGFVEPNLCGGCCSNVK
ncbi:3305_t:CDS:2 [Funneliformis mosseae]|uniref:3305_t:CDS:1 n=1 Tax=Funneliformis mosseae TaxID=27381 RepID=A0A9N8ZUJ6_FUNMO|nr:3305_t:CDS:2 [Funneliformis mosseae]